MNLVEDGKAHIWSTSFLSLLRVTVYGPFDDIADRRNNNDAIIFIFFFKRNRAEKRRKGEKQKVLFNVMLISRLEIFQIGGTLSKERICF